MTLSDDPRAAAIDSVLEELRRHMEAGLAAGHYELALTVRPASDGQRDVIVSGSPQRRFKVPAARVPLFET
jgi:hypothetical protein